MRTGRAINTARYQLAGLTTGMSRGTVDAAAARGRARVSEEQSSGFGFVRLR